jgi:hypothetical protein
VPFARNVFPNLTGIHLIRGFAIARLRAGAYFMIASTITRSNRHTERVDSSAGNVDLLFPQEPAPRTETNSAALAPKKLI